MRVVRVELRDRRDYAKRALPDARHGGIFVPSAEPIEVGTPVLLELSFPEIPEGLFVSGHVVWRRLPTRWRSALPSGFGVEFDPAERTKREFLEDFARGRHSVQRNRSRRLPVRLSARFQPVGSSFEADGETRDIGRGGLFLASETMVRFGSSMNLALFAPPDLHMPGPTSALGRVAWLGHMNGVSGMGVQFLFRSREVRADIEELVSRLEDSLGDRHVGNGVHASSR